MKVNLSKKQWNNIRLALKKIHNEQKKEAFMKKVAGDAKNYFIANFQRIPQDQFIPGRSVHNHSCYYNAIQHASQSGNGCQVKMTAHLVYCVENVGSCDAQFLHMINKTEDGKFIDNTLGFFQQNHDYYYIKECQPESYRVVWDWFEEMRKRFLKILKAEKGLAKYEMRSAEIL